MLTLQFHEVEKKAYFSYLFNSLCKHPILISAM